MKKVIMCILLFAAMFAYVGVSQDVGASPPFNESKIGIENLQKNVVTAISPVISDIGIVKEVTKKVDVLKEYPTDVGITLPNTYNLNISASGYSLLVKDANAPPNRIISIGKNYLTRNDKTEINHLITVYCLRC